LTSPNTLFIKSSQKIKSIEYANISDMEFLTKRKYLIIGLGIALASITLWLQQMNPPDWATESFLGKLMWGLNDGGATYIVVGSVMVLVGFLWKTLCIKLEVSSTHNKLILAGNKNTINHLAQLVNERIAVARKC
jgi:hypothetical protein